MAQRERGHQRDCHQRVCQGRAAELRPGGPGPVQWDAAGATQPGEGGEGGADLAGQSVHMSPRAYSHLPMGTQSPPRGHTVTSPTPSHHLHMHAMHCLSRTTYWLSHTPNHTHHVQPITHTMHCLSHTTCTAYHTHHVLPITHHVLPITHTMYCVSRIMYCLSHSPCTAYHTHHVLHITHNVSAHHLHCIS